MSAGTSIEWTDATWNPIRGCSRVSAGCKNCYAERMAVRMSGPGQWGRGFAEGGPRSGRRGGWTGKVALIPEKLADPLRWKKPRRVFVNSMSDLFHEALPNEAIAAVFGAMAAAPWHTFQVLTKRASRMASWFTWYESDHNKGRYRHPEIIEHAAATARRAGEVLGLLQAGPLDRVADLLCVAANASAGQDTWPLQNVHVGVSVEDQAAAEERVPLLLKTPAAVRWVSYEPALGPVDFTAIESPDGKTFLDWIVVGGESGPGARPFDVAWARSVLQQCRERSREESGVPVFVKQLGARPHDGYLTAKEIVEGERGRPRPADQPLTEAAAAEILGPDFADVPLIRPVHLKDRKGGDMAEWPEDLRVRDFPIKEARS
jgi:protein gp37